METNIFGLPSTVFGSKEWNDLEKKEYELGPEQLLEEIIKKKSWSNVEILWVLKRLIYFYGKKDALLKKGPARTVNDKYDGCIASFLYCF